MADQNVDIKITTKADTSGAKQTTEALKEVGAATQKVAQETNEGGSSAAKAAKSKADLKKVVQELSREYPAMGAAMRLAMNPIAGGVLGLIAYFGKLKQELAGITEVLARNTYANGTAALLEYAEAVRKGEVESYKYKVAIDALSASKQTLADKTGEVIARINEEEEAQKKVMDARKQVELAGATTPEQVAAIEARYGQQGVVSRRAYSAARINAKSAELGALSKEIPDAERAAKADEEKLQQMRAEQALLEKQSETREKNVEASKASEKELKEQLAGIQSAVVYATQAPGLKKAIQAEVDYREQMVGLGAAQDTRRGTLSRQIVDQEQRVGVNTSRLQQMQGRRSLLESEASGMVASESRTQRTEGEVGRLQQIAALTKIDRQQDAEVERLGKDLVEGINKHGDNVAALAAQLRELQKRNRDVEAQLNALRTNPSMQ